MTGVGVMFSISMFTVLGELSDILVAFVIFPNTSASSVSDFICSSPMFGKGVAGSGCFRAWISSFTAIIVFLPNIYIVCYSCEGKTRWCPQFLFARFR